MRGENGLSERRERVYREFAGFLSAFVRELNDMSDDGWSLLVEGKRDSRALRELGYRGQVLTVSLLGSRGPKALRGSGKVVILTDLDKEGAHLASKYLRLLAHEGIETSLSERRRLRAASRGVFLQIENLGRFSEAETGRSGPGGIPTGGRGPLGSVPGILGRVRRRKGAFPS